MTGSKPSPRPYRTDPHLDDGSGLACSARQDSGKIVRVGCLINRQLHGTKLLHSCGIFNNYFSQKVLDKVDQSLLLRNEHTQDGVPCLYEWNGERYILTRLAFLHFHNNCD